MEIDYQELQTPQSWLDFLSGVDREPMSPAWLASQIARLNSSGRKPMDLSGFFIPEEKWRSARTVENIQRLRKSDSLAVVATVHANVLGGTASQFFKCLTAIKVSEALTKLSISAVPVCRISAEPIGKSSIAILDDSGELHNLSLINDVSDLISRVEKLGRGTYDPEVIQMLRDAYSTELPLSAPTTRIFSGLMQEWGLVSLGVCSSGSDESLQDSSSPVIVNIVGFEDVSAFAVASPTPIGWPALSATIMDARSRRTLEKYSLSIGDLFAGEIQAVNKIQSCMPDPGKLSRLRSEVENAMAELESLVSDAEDFLKVKDACKEKIIYQIEKLQKNLGSAIVHKRQTAERRLHRACNLLAPNGNLQEKELGVDLLLRYSSSAFRRLYERLDETVFKHQLIEMD
jgi:uncharacterized protein YllA (UPF0747 family)